MTQNKIVNERKLTLHKAARLFESDRNEDVKLFFLYKRTNNIEVKTQSLLQREQSNLGPLRKLRQFMIGEF